MMPVVFPFFPPFFPFEPLSSAISVSFFWLLAHPAKRADQTSSEFKSDLCRQKRSRIIEGAWLTLRPLIKSRGVHDDFAVRKAVTDTHTSRRRRWLTALSSGPTAATPAEAAAFEVPTAPEPT